MSPSRKSPVPGTPESNKHYPDPTRTALLYLAGSVAAYAIAEFNLLYPELFYAAGVTCGLFGLLNAIAGFRVGLARLGGARRAP